MYEEERRADFYARTRLAGQVLKAIHEKYVLAAACPDFERAQTLVDEAMDVLADFVRQSRPPDRGPGV
jgi:hypothetical protein